jgi:hypothetical protein
VQGSSRLSQLKERVGDRSCSWLSEAVAVLGCCTSSGIVRAIAVTYLSGKPWADASPEALHERVIYGRRACFWSVPVFFVGVWQANNALTSATMRYLTRQNLRCAEPESYRAVRRDAAALDPGNGRNSPPWRCVKRLAVSK